MKEQLVEAIANIEEDDALRLAQEMLESEEEPGLVLEACREAMSIVGDRYETGEYFLPELVIAGDMLTSIGALVKPRLQDGQTGGPPAGSIVIGTVAGDIHDVGKDIVAFMLDANNFEVHDLGVDVSAERFIEKLKEVSPDVLALSGFLTLAFDAMRETVEAIQEAGLRDSVKIMIGGAPMDEKVTQYIGADAFGRDATAAVRLAKEWTAEA